MTVPLHYTLDGPPDAPVVVLGSSLGTSGAMWQPQMEALTASLRVLRYDHRGHGGSPVPPGPYSLDELGRDLLALLDVLDLSRVRLGGLSLGGMVAMWVAANAPERVESLALLCTSAQLGPPSMWRERVSLVRQGGVAAIADTLVARWFTREFATRHAGVVAWARRMLITTPDEGYIGCCAAIEQMDLLASLASITVPALVIAGERDPATPPPHLEKIAAGIADSRLEVLPDAAHLANVERPDVVSRLLLEFWS
ncbi:MAG TPA: 3-oxoadipate enol-lactonase [Candidatus Limnocylindrales bacterium]|nr:3-oxoadipate enol-lactonase [Candidatus Limnocylindrales bacterium]